MTITHHIRQLLVISILLAIGAGLGWHWNKEKPMPVRVQVVERGVVQSSVSNTRAGTVEACRRAKISPSIGGIIAELPIKQGDQVKTGQLLLSLWNDDLTAQIKLAERDAIATRARATETCVSADVSRNEANRLVRLRQQKLASEDDTERAVGDAKARAAACQAARETGRVAQARIDVASKHLQRTILRAPFDGVVAKINGELGEFVTPSPPGIPTPPAVDLIDNRCLYISAPIDEVDASKIKLDLPVRISLDAFPGQTFDGTVRRIAPFVLELEKQARTVDVEAVFSNPGDYEKLLAGYSADLEIILDTRQNVLFVPTEALLEGQRVLVYSPDDQRLHSRKLEIGISNWKQSEVISGLKEGERVVTNIDREGVEADALAKLE
jgi:HlyD family secretion protein